MTTNGLRGRFSYGYPQAIGKSTLMDIDGIRIMRDDAFNDEKRGLLSLGLCVRGPDRCDPAVWRGEWAAARALKLPITTHIASDRAAGAMGNIARLHREGLLGPDVLMVHATHASDADLRLWQKQSRRCRSVSGPSSRSAMACRRLRA